MSCSACRGVIVDDEGYLRCMVESCKKIYHPPCTGGKNPTAEERKTWVCPECYCATKRGGDNNLTPVGIAKKTRDPNVTFRSKNIQPVVAGVRKYDEPSELSVEIRGLKSEMATLRDQLTHAVSLLTSYETKLDNYALQVIALSTKLEGYESRVLRAPEVSVFRSLPSPVISPTSKNQVQGTKRLLKSEQPQGAVSTSGSGLKGVPAASVVNEGKNGNKSVHMHQVKIVESNDVTAQADQQWIEVKRRRSRGPTSLCGAAGPAITTLKAVEPVKYLHLWNMASSADDVLQYLRQLCPTGSCTVQELTPKGNYKSFKIGVPEAHYVTCYSIDVWPINARIKAWINYGKREGPARGSVIPGTTTPSNQLPFRSAEGAQ